MQDALLATLVLAQETTEEDSGSDLIKVVPGLMIWTAITFVIVFFVLKKLAFGRIQGMIDDRRDRIREALDEADARAPRPVRPSRRTVSSSLRRRCRPRRS